MPTLIVAPSGGTHTTIQGALTAAVNGDLIQITGGSYTEDLITTADCTIELLGDVTVTGTADHVLDIVHSVTMTRTGYWLTLKSDGNNLYALRIGGGTTQELHHVNAIGANVATGGRAMLVHQLFTGTADFYSCMFARSETTGMELKGGTLSFYGCICSDCDYGRALYLSYAGAVVNWNNSILLGSGNYAASIGAVAATLNINNSIVLSSGIGDPVVEDGSGTLTLTNSYVLPSPMTVAASKFGAYTDGGNNIGLIANDDTPIKWATPRRPTASVSFMIDDYTNEAAFIALKNVCEARGVVASWSFEPRPLGVPISAADWTRIAGYQAAGHSISSHGMTASSMVVDATLDSAADNNQGFDVQHTGVGSACDLFIDNEGGDSTIRFEITGETDVSFDTSQYTIQQLIDAIEAHGSFTVTNKSLLGVHIPATIMANQALTDCKTSAVTITKEMSRYYAHELDGSMLEFATNGVPVTTYVYSTYGGNANARAAVKAAGYVCGRSPRVDPLTGGRRTPLKWYPYSHDAVHMTGNGIEPATDLKRSVMALCHWAMLTGTPLNLFNHDLATTTSEAEWVIIVDAVISTGIPIMGYQEQMEMVDSYLVSVDGDEYTVDFEATDKAWVAQLADDSTLIAAGASSATDTSIGIDGEPFSNFERSIGASQSKAVPFHPVNL